MNKLLTLGAKTNIGLKDYCTFNIGGNAKYLIEAKNKTHLLNVCKECKLHNIKYKVIGIGANLLFDDKGFNGTIIVAKFNNIKINNTKIIADAGTNLTALITIAANNSLSGLEELAGIPATIGGAIVNNVSSHNTCIADYVEYVECYKKNNLSKKLVLAKKDCLFGYRSSIFSSCKYIITKVCFNFNRCETSEIKHKISEAIKAKQTNQPLNYPSAGSIFKRGKLIASKVIDELGLKGLRIGDAQVSTKHAGFIVNVGSASSKDVKALISIIKDKVLSVLGETLENEIEIVQ